MGFFDGARDVFFRELVVLLNCRVVDCKSAAKTTLQLVRRAVGSDAFVAATTAKLSGSALLDVLKVSEDKKKSSGVASKLSMRERMRLMKAKQQQLQALGDAENTNPNPNAA